MEILYGRVVEIPTELLSISGVHDLAQLLVGQISPGVPLKIKRPGRNRGVRGVVSNVQLDCWRGKRLRCERQTPCSQPSRRWFGSECNCVLKSAKPAPHWRRRSRRFPEQRRGRDRAIEMMSPGARLRRWRGLAGFRSPDVVTWGGAVDSTWASSFGLKPPQCQPWHTDAWRLRGANLQLKTDRLGWNTAVIIPIQ